jgi:hypothetical protein
MGRQEVTGVALVESVGTLRLIDGYVAGVGVTMASGRRVRIVDIAAEDAFYAQRSELVGMACSTGEGFVASSAGAPWMSGSLICGGEDRYFYKVRVE